MAAATVAVPLFIVDEVILPPWGYGPARRSPRSCTGS
jgi:hypothetical protein